MPGRLVIRARRRPAPRRAARRSCLAARAPTAGATVAFWDPPAGTIPLVRAWRSRGLNQCRRGPNRHRRGPNRPRRGSTATARTSTAAARTSTATARPVTATARPARAARTSDAAARAGPPRPGRRRRGLPGSASRHRRPEPVPPRPGRHRRGPNRLPPASARAGPCRPARSRRTARPAATGRRRARLPSPPWTARTLPPAAGAPGAAGHARSSGTPSTAPRARWHHGREHRRRGQRRRRGLRRPHGAVALPPPRFHLPGMSHGPATSQSAASQQKTGGRFQRKRPPAKFVRRRPTLPRGPPRSTIGAEGLNFRVRNGTGCFPFAMATETLWRCGARPHLGNRTVDACTRVWESPPRPGGCRSQATRPISTGQLHVLPRFHFRPINPVV